MDHPTLRATLINFYQDRNPSKVSEVDVILKKFSKVGHDHLISELEKKYGVRLSDYSPPLKSPLQGDRVAAAARPESQAHPSPLADHPPAAESGVGTTVHPPPSVSPATATPTRQSPSGTTSTTAETTTNQRERKPAPSATRALPSKAPASAAGSSSASASAAAAASAASPAALVASLRAQLKEAETLRARDASHASALVAKLRREADARSQDCRTQAQASSEREARAASKVRELEKSLAERAAQAQGSSEREARAAFKVRELEKNLAERVAELQGLRQEKATLSAQVVDALEAKESAQAHLELLLESVGRAFNPYRDPPLAGKKKKSGVGVENGRCVADDDGGAGSSSEGGETAPAKTTGGDGRGDSDDEGGRGGGGGGVGGGGAAAAASIAAAPAAASAAEVAVLLRAKAELELQARDDAQLVEHLARDLKTAEASLLRSEERAQALEHELGRSRAQVEDGRRTAEALHAAVNAAEEGKAAAEVEAARLGSVVKRAAAARREVLELGLREREAVWEASREQLRLALDRSLGMALEDSRAQQVEVGFLVERAASLEAGAAQAELGALSEVVVGLKQELQARDKQVAELQRQLARAAKALVAHAPRPVVEDLVSGKLVVE